MHYLHLICLFMLVTRSASALCQDDEDCSQFTTFCEGPFVCNNGGCVPRHEHYDPCRQIKSNVATVRSQSNAAYTMSILCLNEVSGCVALHYCVRDEDCDDQRYCNGKERCVDGQCAKAVDLSHVCADCDESTHCGMSATFTQEDGSAPADPTIVYAAVIGLIVIGSIAVFLVLVLVCQWASTSAARRR